MKTRIALALALLAALCIGAAAQDLTKEDLVKEAKSKITQISVQQAEEFQQAGNHLFLDCREPGEFAAGHIPGAMNIPRGLLEFKIAKAVPDKATPIVGYCKTGGRGSLSVCALRCMGYANAVNLDGGWQAWAKAGLPVEKSPGAAAAVLPAAGTKQELVKQAKAQITEVTPEEAKAMLDRGWTYFIDCREPVEFNRGHIPGALNIARGWLEFRIAETVPDKNATVVLYCKSGDRSSLGVLSLNRMGYANAVNLEGGWKAWLKTDYPVE